MKLIFTIDIDDMARCNRGHIANALRKVANEILGMGKWFYMAGTEHPITDHTETKIGHWKLEE